MKVKANCEMISLWCFCSLLHYVTSDSRLILTPYVQRGDIDTARTKCKVEPDIGNVTSYSGFFTVNETCDNNLFFWFFPARTNWLEAPVVLWLQGGPGSSSMFGAFEEVGPFNSFDDGLKPRNYSWTNISNVLFIDNPVGAGFSYTTKECYPTTIEQVVKELYSALVQFFKLFHELQKNKFFLAGESFAGHYLPPLAVLIHESIESSKAEVNMTLKGIICGNPLIKLDCHDYATFLYQVGVLSEQLRDKMYFNQSLLKENVAAGNFSAAFENWSFILNDLLRNETRVNRYNFLGEDPDPSNYDIFVNMSSTKEQLHAGDQTYNDVNMHTYEKLKPTIAKSYTGAVEQLLKTGKYIVAFFGGQLDVICLYPSTVCMMRSLDWPGAKDYLAADRPMWFFGDDVVGFTRNASYKDAWLLDIFYKGAGHSVITYKPHLTYFMADSIMSAPQGVNPLWRFKTTDDD